HRLDHLSPHVGRRERPPHGRARAQPWPRARRRPRVVPRRTPPAGPPAGGVRRGTTRGLGRVRDEGLVSFLGVPLLLEDQPVGILTVATREPRVFAPDEVRLVEALANSASVAIWNARLWEQTQQRLSETQTLLVVSQAAGSILDVTEIGRRTIREMVRALGAEMGGVWRRNEGGRDFVPVAGY